MKIAMDDVDIDAIAQFIMVDGYFKYPRGYCAKYICEEFDISLWQVSKSIKILEQLGFKYVKNHGNTKLMSHKFKCELCNREFDIKQPHKCRDGVERKRYKWKTN